MHSLGLCLEKSFPCVAVRNHKQCACAWSWNHAAGITYVPVWLHLQCAQLFGFWSYFQWQPLCAVIWFWGNQSNWCASCCLCRFLDQCISPINTWRRTVRHKRSRTTYPCKHSWLKKGLPPTARRICPSASRRWTPKHNWYRPDCQRNYPRTSI